MAYTVWDELRLKQQAIKLSRRASEYRTFAREIEALEGGMAGWESNAADIWKGKLGTLKAEIHETAAEMESIAASIRSFVQSHRYLLEQAVGEIDGFGQ